MLENDDCPSSKGTNVLERRFDNLQQQASDVRNDLRNRAEMYLTENTKEDMFLLPLSTQNTQPFDLVMKEALYVWTKRHMFDGAQLPYEQVQRVVSQILNHPNQRIWQMSIGNSYTIVRYGNALRIIHSDSNANIITTATITKAFVMTRLCSTKMNGTILSLSDDKDEWVDINIRQLGTAEPLHQIFIQTTVGLYHKVAEDLKNKSHLPAVPEAALPSLSFTPPWKKRSTGSHKPIRMNDFLRGQDIPLHERPDISIILSLTISDELFTTDLLAMSSVGQLKLSKDVLSMLVRSTATTVVGVYVPTKQKWIIDRHFLVHHDDDLNSDVHDSTVVLSISVVTP